MGNDFILTKAQVIEAFGAPKINFPKYECGGYSDDVEGGPYYQLIYAGFRYIGSDQQTFILEEVQLDAAGKTSLRYDGQILNGQTTKAAFVKIFGDYAKAHFEQEPDSDGILLYDSNSDDGGVFIFKNGKLVAFEYWSDC